MASGDRLLGVRVRQLRVPPCLHFRCFSEAANAAVRMVAGGSLGRVRNRGARGGGLFSADRVSAGPLSSQTNHPAVSGCFWMRVCLALADDAASLAFLRDLSGAR